MKRTILLVEYNEEMLEFIADDLTSFISTNTRDAPTNYNKKLPHMQRQLSIMS